MYNFCTILKFQHVGTITCIWIQLLTQIGNMTIYEGRMDFVVVSMDDFDVIMGWNSWWEKQPLLCQL